MMRLRSVLIVLAGLGGAGCGAEEAATMVDAAVLDAASPDSGAVADAELGTTADAAPIDAGAAGPAPPPTDFPLELGLGEQQFTAVPHGAVARLHRGCQGAQHVWISLRSPTLSPDAYLMTLSAHRVDDGEEAVPAHNLEFDWVAADAGGAELVGVTLVIFDPLLVVDEDVDVQAEIQTADGRMGRAVRRMRIEWGADEC